MYQTTEIASDDLVERCRNGDKQAYFQIYQKYAKPMLNSSMRIVNNLADAEDMVQEAFVDAFKNLQNFSYKSSFEGWLRKIVINKSITLLRKRKVNFVEIDSNYSGNASEEYNEDKFNCDVQSIKQALQHLPETQRIIFNLFAIDGVPQEEIGNILGISHSNVRIQYYRAKNKILDIIKSKSLK